MEVQRVTKRVGYGLFITGITLVIIDHFITLQNYSVPEETKYELARVTTKPNKTWYILSSHNFHAHTGYLETIEQKISERLKSTRDNVIPERMDKRFIDFRDAKKKYYTELKKINDRESWNIPIVNLEAIGEPDVSDVTEPKIDASALSAAVRRKPAQMYQFDDSVCDDRNDIHLHLPSALTVANRVKRNEPSILCITYTIASKHDTAIKAIQSTWGSKCDGFIVVSTKDDKSIPSVNLHHLGEEKYENIWQKIRSTWKYVYKHYRDDFEYFYIGGDDVFLFVENLRDYLLSDEVKKATENGKLPLYLGRRLKRQGKAAEPFNAGGSGYVLNRAALEILVRSLPTCYPRAVSFAEDVFVSRCFRKHGIYPVDSRDEFGRERFIPISPRVALRHPPQNDWYSNWSYDLQFGPFCCAEKTIAFHYIEPSLMIKMYNFVYFCPFERKVDVATKTYNVRPQSGRVKKLDGYRVKQEEKAVA